MNVVNKLYILYQERPEQYYDGSLGVEKDVKYASTSPEHIKEEFDRIHDEEPRMSLAVEKWEDVDGRMERQDITESMLLEMREKAYLEGYPYKVYLAPDLDSAEKFAEENGVDITIEAKYGDTLVEGEVLSLAHHGSRADNDAPCVDYYAKEYGVQYTGNKDILISHIDLDTVGGVMLATGQTRQYSHDREERELYEKEVKFWNDAAYIDVNGPHHIHELTPDTQNKFNAIYAWNENNGRARFTEVTDVTDRVNEYIETVKIVLDEKHPLHNKLIEDGQKWAEAKTKDAQEHCVFENDKVRAFITDGPSFSSSYYSPSQETVIPATVQLNNKFGTVTLAFADGGKEKDAAGIMKELFGDGAGGRAGIAGSPRGEKMTEEDLKTVISKITDILKEEIVLNGRNEGVRGYFKNETLNFTSKPENDEKIKLNT